MKLPENLTPCQDELFESYPNEYPDRRLQLTALRSDLFRFVNACYVDPTATTGERELAEAVSAIVGRVADHIVD